MVPAHVLDSPPRAAKAPAFSVGALPEPPACLPRLVAQAPAAAPPCTPAAAEQPGHTAASGQGTAGSEDATAVPGAAEVAAASGEPGRAPAERAAEPARVGLAACAAGQAQAPAQPAGHAAAVLAPAGLAACAAEGPGGPMRAAKVGAPAMEPAGAAAAPAASSWEQPCAAGAEVAAALAGIGQGQRGVEGLEAAERHGLLARGGEAAACPAAAQAADEAAVHALASEQASAAAPACCAAPGVGDGLAGSCAMAGAGAQASAPAGSGAPAPPLHAGNARRGSEVLEQGSEHVASPGKRARVAVC